MKANGLEGFDNDWFRSKQELVRILEFVENDALWFSVGCNAVPVLTIHRDAGNNREFKAIKRALVSYLDKQIALYNKAASDAEDKLNYEETEDVDA